jgi:hypothetical protein
MGYVITLNAGSQNGVIEGLEFYYAEGSRKYMSLVIKEVRKNTSIAGVSMIGGSVDNVRPKVGMKFSSKMPRGFIEPG